MSVVFSSIGVGLIGSGNVASADDAVYRTVGVYRKRGHPVVLCVDLEKTSQPFIDMIGELGARVVPFGTLAEMLVGAFTMLDTPWVLYSEGNKYRFAEEWASDFLSSALSDEHPLTVASRNYSSFATYPEIQQVKESAFRKWAAEQAGVDLDLVYGPKLVTRDVAQLLARVPADFKGWEPLLWLVGRCVKTHGADSVSGIEGTYTCPQERRGEIDLGAMRHRFYQFAGDLLGFYRGLTGH